MKKISIAKVVFVFIAFFFSVSLHFNAVKASSVTFINGGGGKVGLSQEVSIPIAVDSDTEYNAVTLTVEFANLTFVRAVTESGWMPVEGPKAVGNKVNFSGAVLGNSYKGKKDVITIVFKTPANAGNSIIKSSGSVAITVGNTAVENKGLGNSVILNAVSGVTSPQVNVKASSDLVLSVPNNSTFTSNAPALSGKSKPNSKVEVTIESTNGTQKGQTTAIPSGYWSYVPQTPLSDGAHKYSAREVNSDGTLGDAAGPISFNISASKTDTFPTKSPAITYYPSPVKEDNQYRPFIIGFSIIFLITMAIVGVFKLLRLRKS